MDHPWHRQKGAAGLGRHRLPWAVVLAAVLVLASVTDKLATFATNVVGDLGLPGVFLLMVAESACIPIPSEATMLFAGFNVHRGRVPAVGGRRGRFGGEPRRVVDRLRASAITAVSSCSRSTGSSCTSRPRTSRGPTAGSSATARRPSSSAGCSRSSAPSSRCRPASRGCRSGSSPCSRSPAACPGSSR